MIAKFMLFSLLGFFSFSGPNCSKKNTSISIDENTQSLGEIDPVKIVEDTKSLNGEKKRVQITDFVGCWSAGDRGSTAIKITNVWIETTINRQRIKYLIKPNSSRNGRIILELSEEDDSNYLKKFVTLQVQDNERLVLEQYETYYDALNSDKSVGNKLFFKDDCKNVSRRLRSE